MRPRAEARSGRRRWAWIAPISLLALLSHLVGLAVSPDGVWPAEMSVSMLGVTATVLALAAGCLLCCDWWISHNQGSAWVGAILLALSIALLPFRLVGLDPDAHRVTTTPPTVVDDVVALSLALMLLVALRRVEFRRRIGPIVLGSATGLAFGTLCLLYTAGQLESWAGAPARPQWLGQCLGLLLGVATVWVIEHLDSLPRWARRELQVAVALCTLAWLVAHRAAADVGTWDVVAAAVGLGALVLVTTTATELLLRALRDTERRLRVLSDRAELAERATRRDEEMMHEVRGSVAALSSASRILAELDAQISEDDHGRLQHLVAAEVDRLHRMVSRQAEAPESVALDAVLAELVATHRYLGLGVEWWPGDDVTAWARPSDVAEIVQILLHNAARHAPGSTVTVRTRRVRDVAEIEVSDDGPGITPEMRDLVFERGVRRSESCGQGLGLHIARRLAVEQQGTVLVAPDTTSGASFLVRLPVGGTAS